MATQGPQINPEHLAADIAIAQAQEARARSQAISTAVRSAAQEQADQIIAAGERRAALIEQGTEMRATRLEQTGKLRTRAAKEREKALKERIRQAKQQGKPGAKVTDVLDGGFAQVEPGASAIDPTQIPVSEIGPGGPQGVQQSREQSQSPDVAGEAGTGVESGASGIGQAPQFTVAGRFQRDVAPQQIGIGNFAPVESTRQITDVQQNALTPYQTLRARIEMAKVKNENMEDYYDNIGRALYFEGTDAGTRAAAQAAFQRLSPQEQEDVLFRGNAALQAHKQLSENKTVTYLKDGQVWTGRLSDLPEGGAPGLDRTPRVNVRNIIDVTKPTLPMTTALQEQLVAMTGRAQSFANVAESFDPKFLQFGPRTAYGVGAFSEKVGARLSSDFRAELDRYTTWKGNAAKLINDALSELGGKTLTANEIKRNQAALPDPDRDSATQFVAKFNARAKDIQLGTIRYYLLLNEGFGDENIARLTRGARLERQPDGTFNTEPLIGLIPLDEQTLLGHMERVESQIRQTLVGQGMSREQAEALAEQRTAEMFGNPLDQYPLIPAGR